MLAYAIAFGAVRLPLHVLEDHFKDPERNVSDLIGDFFRTFSLESILPPESLIPDEDEASSRESGEESADWV